MLCGETIARDRHESSISGIVMRRQHRQTQDFRHLKSVLNRLPTEVHILSPRSGGDEMTLFFIATVRTEISA
jgi:hypothetical protein